MNEKYIGQKCIVCNNAFKDDDDIVVCPDCGTPYHRHCWEIENACVNTELHERGQVWSPQDPDESSLPKRCLRCGMENPPENRFCGECGLPLNTDPDALRPFNNGYNAQGQGAPDPSQFGDPGQGGFGFMPNVRQVRLTPQSDIDGVKLGDYLEYIGGRSLTLIATFIKFAKTGAKLSFNLFAFIFPALYFFYRKMNKQGVLFLLVSFVLNIPMLIYYGQTGMQGTVLFNTSIDIKSNEFITFTNLCSLLDMALSIIAALYANYWYYSKAKDDIIQIRSKEDITDADAVLRIKTTGGTSWPGVIAAIAGEMLLTLAFLLVMTSAF